MNALSGVRVYMCRNGHNTHKLLVHIVYVCVSVLFFLCTVEERHTFYNISSLISFHHFSYSEHKAISRMNVSIHTENTLKERYSRTSRIKISNESLE